MGKHLTTDDLNEVKVNADGSLDTNITGDVTIATGEKIIITDGTHDLDINQYNDIGVVLKSPTGSDIDLVTGGIPVTIMAIASNTFLNLKDGSNALTIESDGSLNVTATVADELKDADLVSYSFSWTSATTDDIWTPASGKRFVLCDVIIGCSDDAVVTLYDEYNTNDDRIMKLLLKEFGGLAHSYKKPYKSGAINRDLKFNASAGSGYVTVSGYEI